MIGDRIHELGNCPFAPHLFGAARPAAISENPFDVTNTDPRLSEYLRKRQVLGRRYDKYYGQIEMGAKSGTLDQMMGLAQEIERDWSGVESDYSTALYGAAAAGLMWRFHSPPEAVALAVRLGNAALDRIGEPGLQTFQN